MHAAPRSGITANECVGSFALTYDFAWRLTPGYEQQRRQPQHGFVMKNSRKPEEFHTNPASRSAFSRVQHQPATARRLA